MRTGEEGGGSLKQPTPLLIRFFKLVDRSDVESCWLWKGFRKENGYGNLFIERVNGKAVMDGAHRVSYRLFVGPIPDGMHVCHRCDNPRCVNPKHLFLGTPRDNMQDKKQKGRAISLRGEASPRAKLTDAQVADILSLRVKGVSSLDIASQFHISRGHAYRIFSGKQRHHTTITETQPA